MKRVLAFVSAICLLIAFLPAAVTAETYEGLTYSVSGGQVTITDCDASVTGALTIPDTIAGYPVTTIAMSAFADCTGLTGVTIGNTVTSVGSGAFAGCTGLTAITVAEGNPVYHSNGNCLIETSSKTLVAGCKESVIPADGSVTAIGRLAFYKCTELEAVALPECILSVGVSAFEGCTALASLDLGKVKSIGNSAFLNCTALQAVTIPDSVETMGVYAFSGCTGMTAVAMGNSLATIANSAFANCTALTDVNIGTGVMAIDVFAFSGCSKLAEVVIPGGVESIGKFAFYNCAMLTSVQIPVSVTEMGKNAFSGCESLRLYIQEGNTYAVEYALTNDIYYSVLGLGGIAVTTVNLRPGVAGVYFGSSLSWAEDHPEVDAYGIAVSTSNPLPVADDSDEASLYTTGSTSVLIKDVMKSDNPKETNVRNANKKIYARVYVRLTSGEYRYSEAVQVTLRQVVIAAQNKWELLDAAQKDALTQMYATYSEIMSSWNMPNLK